MNRYKFLFWCVAFAVYLFIMWFALPSIGIEGVEAKGIEVSYISAVIQSHLAAGTLVSFLFIFSWLANKAGY